MTAVTDGLIGQGTKIDPWLISSDAALGAVLRDPAGEGYFRVTMDCSYSGSGGLSSSEAGTYKSKIIDADGYAIAMVLNSASAGAAIMAGVTLLNCYLRVQMLQITSTAVSVPFFNCYFTDCLVNASTTSTNNSLLNNGSAFYSLEPKQFNRVVFVGGFLGAYDRFVNIGAPGDTVFTDVVKWTSTIGSWYTRTTTAPTLASLDALFEGRFTAAGWFDDATLPAPRPYFVEFINLVIDTLVLGVPTARPLLYEAGGRYYGLGQTDSSGHLNITLRVRRRLTFRVVVSEDVGLDRLQEGNYVAANKYYLPPSGDSYRYLASAAGHIVGLSGVTFGGSPVVLNGVTYTPSAVYPEMASSRTSLQTGGAQQLFTFDTASLGGGGGGPVIDGDPAYLDGVVEEIHPLLGTVRALVNAEVSVFEKRDTGYVVMGSAYSNAVGEFRVNTEVYGGGDVFAFAADFPGVAWQAGLELRTGTRLRPTVNNGYVYEVITPGNSGATEPTWWADAGDGTEGAIGAATAKARPYYQPVGHGPLKMTFVE